MVFTVNLLIEQDDLIRSDWTVEGAHTGIPLNDVSLSDQSLTINGTALLRMGDGKIVENWGGPHCQDDLASSADPGPSSSRWRVTSGLQGSDQGKAACFYPRLITLTTGGGSLLSDGRSGCVADCHVIAIRGIFAPVALAEPVLTAATGTPFDSATFHVGCPRRPTTVAAPVWLCLPTAGTERAVHRVIAAWLGVADVTRRREPLFTVLAPFGSISDDPVALAFEHDPTVLRIFGRGKGLLHLNLELRREPWLDLMVGDEGRLQRGQVAIPNLRNRRSGDQRPGIVIVGPADSSRPAVGRHGC
jgi:hypothetical protein